DAELGMLKNAPVIKSRDRVHFYAGTSETLARIIVYNGEEARPGVSCYCQFRLEDRVVVLSGDRYIIRSFSPLETIGGGKILDPSPVRRKKSAGIDDLVVFKDGSLKDKVGMKVRQSRLRGVSAGEIIGWVQDEIPEIESAIRQLLEEGVLVRSHNLLFHKDGFNAFRETVMAEVGRFHKENPLKQGVPKEELRDRVRVGLKDDEKFFDGLIAMINDLTIDKDMIRLTGFSVALSNAEEGTKRRILEALDKEGFQPPLKSDLARQLSIKEKELNDLLMLLAKDGLLVRISDSIYITKLQYDSMIVSLKKFYAKKSEMSIAEFRDILGTTRKYALPFVEYLDTKKITLRVGDIRKLMLK
ncbi:MAG TPA: SelB C-terminal domain-containing protein, partial [Dissulfurispiraceae bacterium]|nr:SelB C-terminal domain-containing protein [Dissulfurispiraceae bacterium]